MPTPITATHEHTSLVVTTRERPSDLGRCLTAIKHLSRPPAEVVVINNGSDPATEEVLTNHPDVRVVPEHAQHLPQVFNRGWQEVDTPFVGYLADDVEPEAQWLEMALETISTDIDIGVVTGPIISTTWPAGEMHRMYLAADSHPASRFAARLYNRVVLEGQLMAPGYLAESGAYSLGASLPQARNLPGPIEIDLPTTSSMIIRRSALQAVGGFRHRYRYNHADGDLFVRLKQHGYRMLFDPRVVAHHHVRPGPSRSPYYIGRDGALFLMDHCRPRTPRGAAGAILNVLVLIAYWCFQSIVQRSVRPLLGLTGMVAGVLHGLRPDAMDTHPRPPE